MQAGGYQPPPGNTTVVVVQDQNSWRNRGYLRQGVQMGGFILSLPVIICLGIFGGFFIFTGIITLSFGSAHEDLFDDDDDDSVNPSIVVGVVMLLIGIGLVIGCIFLARYAKKKYNENVRGGNPGRVINQNPSPAHQPGALAPGGVPQMMQYPPSPGMMPPPGVYGPQPMGTYPHSPTGQPMGYPPAETAPPYAPPGQSAPSYDHLGQGAQPYPPPQPSQGGGEKAYPPPGVNPYAPGMQAPAALPGMTGDPSKPPGTEYSAPPPYAPDYKPPY